MKYKPMLFAFLLVLFLGACRALTPTPSPAPTAMPKDTPTPKATAKPTETPVPTVVPTTNTPIATPTAVPPTSTPTPQPTVTTVIQVQPTLTAHPGGDERLSVRDLAMSQSGNYVNLTFGYWLQYPPTWYTGFGNRPLLVSFSNLDPGTHNRHSMRTEGCLIEINALTNIYGFTLQDLQAQRPRSFPNAEDFDLDGEPALLVRSSSEENLFDSEWIYVGHGDRLFVLTFEYARAASESCRPAWEDLLSTWQWFEPDFAVYRNTNYGYAISYPRHWYGFSPREEGISISSDDPKALTERVEFLKIAMLVETNVIENPISLPLKEWLAEQDWKIDLTNDISLDKLMGVRVLREGPSPEIQDMSGYFQGPLGRIYVVTCLYPADRQWEFRPIANAIIYSFSF